jgi:hypothetical protein
MTNRIFINLEIEKLRFLLRLASFTMQQKICSVALIHASQGRAIVPLDRSARGDVTGGDQDGEAVTGPGVKPAW